MDNPEEHMESVEEELLTLKMMSAFFKESRMNRLLCSE